VRGLAAEGGIGRFFVETIFLDFEVLNSEIPRSSIMRNEGFL